MPAAIENAPPSSGQHNQRIAERPLSRPEGGHAPKSPFADEVRRRRQCDSFPEKMKYFCTRGSESREAFSHWNSVPLAAPPTAPASFFLSPAGFPGAIAARDESAQPLQTRLVGRATLEVGEDFRQCRARGRPLVKTHDVHPPRMADRAVDKLCDRDAHRASPVLSPGNNPV